MASEGILVVHSGTVHYVLLVGNNVFLIGSSGLGYELLDCSSCRMVH